MNDQTPTTGETPGRERTSPTERASTPAPAATGSPGAARRGPDMGKHLTLLGALHLAAGAVLLAVALFVFVAVAGGGLISRDPDAIAIATLVGITVATFLSLLALPGLAAGWGLLKRRWWSRILALIIGAVNLLNVPFGTALGVYTIWVLMQDETVVLLEGERPEGGT